MPTALSKPAAKTVSSNRRIDSKQAVHVAFDAFSEFYPSLVDANLMLEEIEESDDGKYWFITLGYDAKRTLSPRAKLFESEMYRAYKIFRIDSMSGKVGAMKIRIVQ